MGTLLNRYTRIHGTLLQYGADLDRARQLLKDVQQLHTCQVADAEAALKERLAENAKHTVRVNAYIAIAKTHTTRLKESGLPIPYDNGKLSRLAVQVNCAYMDDPFATQLYTEATGQLQYLTAEYQRMQRAHENKVRSLDAVFAEKRQYSQGVIAKAESGIKAFLQSTDFKDFIALIEEDVNTFHTVRSAGMLSPQLRGTVSLGTVSLPLPIPKNLHAVARSVTKDYFDAQTGTICVPANLCVSDGALILAEYENAGEQVLLSGIQNYILNIARHYPQDYSQVCFIDPIRYNSSGLGCLAELTKGPGSFIDEVPDSADALRNKVKSVIKQLSIRQEGGKADRKNALYVFHNFPQSYDASMVAQIQQLCVNARHYGITVILTTNQSSKTYASGDTLAFLRTMAVTVTGDSISGIGQNITAPFVWYFAPPELPSDIEQKLVRERPVVNLSNDYQQRIGLPLVPGYRKGNRAITDIPYGVDSNGEIQRLDFENNNFASYICGASRSGKSTLLHTLISGFLATKHPDDLELWLIDFNMTEFSRYIAHLPPHVRYILLDKSPELVYDIIDRLTEIMIKRQNIFKGKWQKLKEVPAEKYMPAIMVVIDEFTAMSQAVTDSVVFGKENYAIKLQNLLTMGAKVGLHFIFASQGFTSGTRGLTDLAKKQVQQRIAMRTEYSEIKDTLDLKSPSDEDKTCMEQLPVYHALIRVPEDAYGNHLCLSKVLYISDYSLQEAMIDSIDKQIKPVVRYDANNLQGYIHKKPLIVDSNTYDSFHAKTGEMQAYLSSRQDVLADSSELVLFLGEPRRMMPIFPVHLTNEFSENMLLVAPVSEKMPAASVVLSVCESLNLQGREVELWSARKNPIYRHIRFDCQKRYAERNNLSEICRKIRRLKTAIQNRIEGQGFYVLIGFESILLDMSYQTGPSLSAKPASSQPTYEKRAAGEPDLLTQMGALSADAPAVHPSAAERRPSVSAPISPEVAEYDAREDLKYILTNGPRLGYHFLMHFSSAGDVNQSKLDVSRFKHKVMFRAPKNEAALIIGAANSSVVAELEEHSYRYSNGLDSLSFRPYLHTGLSWDGWQLSGGKVVNVVDEEEEYLL